MISRNDARPTSPSLEPIFDVIANWVKKYPYTAGAPQEVTRTASDLGVSPGELVYLASKVTDQLPQLLLALGVDPKKLASDNPAMMRDLQRRCITCTNKRRCERELAAGTTAQHYRGYCLNAIYRFFVVWAV